MKHAILAGARIVLTIIGTPREAFAGVWRWDCMGPLGDQQIIFTRYNLIIVPSKPSRGNLRDLIFLDDLTKGPSEIEQYIAADVNSGLVPKMEFTLGDDQKNKITLTEKSSKTISHHTAMVCGRDESTEVSRKVYHYERNGEPTRDVTLQCREYMLTTRGGRPCIDRP